MNFDDMLEAAVKEGNPYALKVGSLEEKPIRDKLIEMLKQRESMCKDVIDMVDPIVNKLRKLNAEIQSTESQIYEISGEWGIDDIEEKVSHKYYSYLWDVSDGYLNGEQIG